MKAKKNKWAYYTLAFHIQKKYMLHRWSFKKQKPIPFLLITSGKCGSTWLTSLLQSHPSILAYGDIFGEKLFTKLPYNKHEEPIRLIASVILKPTTPQLKAVGAKLFSSQVIENQEGFRNFLEQHPEIRIIHLERDLAVEQFMSLSISKKTGVWSATLFDKKSDPKPFAADPADLLDYLVEQRKIRDQLESLLPPASTLKISYESLRKHPELILAKVQRFLNMEQRPLYSFLVPSTQKPAREYIINADKLEQVALEAASGQSGVASQ